MNSSFFSFLQKIGRALMLPVAVLPVAGLLLGVGASLFNEPSLNADLHPYIHLIASLMKNSGDAVFGNLPLIFAIGVALGLAKNDGGCHCRHRWLLYCDRHAGRHAPLFVKSDPFFSLTSFV